MKTVDTEDKDYQSLRAEATEAMIVGIIYDWKEKKVECHDLVLAIACNIIPVEIQSRAIAVLNDIDKHNQEQLESISDEVRVKKQEKFIHAHAQTERQKEIVRLKQKKIGTSGFKALGSDVILLDPAIAEWATRKERLLQIFLGRKGMGQLIVSPIVLELAIHARSNEKDLKEIHLVEVFRTIKGAAEVAVDEILTKTEYTKIVRQMEKLGEAEG